MAFATKFVLFIVLFCSVVMQDASVLDVLTECSTGHGCVYAKAASQEIQNRKVLYGLQGKEVVFKSSVDRPTSSDNDGGNLVGWELRKVPSGPDPLHHNGGGPKKPKTP